METTRKDRTRHTVSEALLSLMLEKPYSEITVEDLLDRAEISRSTFYSHFDGKDDLLRSYHNYFFEHVARACMQRDGHSIRIAPMAAVLTHLADKTYRDFYLALIRTGMVPALRALDIDRLSARFESEFLHQCRGRDPRVPLPLVARFVATTFLDLIDWWVENDSPHSPGEMEAMFHSLVEPSSIASSSLLASRPQAPPATGKLFLRHHTNVRSVPAVVRPTRNQTAPGVAPAARRTC